MPVQTTETDYIWFMDGTKVSVKEYGAVSYTDIGAINQGTKAVLNYDITQKETGNAGKLARRLRNPTIDISFDLINLNPANIVKLSGGLFSSSTTAASANTTAPNQVIAANWNDNVKYEIVMYESSTDSTKLKLSAKPVFTSVTLDATGTPEVLAEIGAGAGGDYLVVADADAYSGWSIIFNSAGMTTGTPKTKAITIDFGSNTPVAKTTLWCGSSSVVLNPLSVKFTHTDSAGLTREAEIFACDANSGAFNFNFGGANEDDVEMMPISLTGRLDSTLTDARQLMSFSVDTGAA